jgi:hypothetical protein
MKYVCPPGMVWLIRRLGRVKPGNIVRYSYPGRPHLIYVRRYVVPRNPRTPAQAHMRQLFGTLSKDWLALLTPPQRDAWIAFARNYHRRWGAVWIAYARYLNSNPPHVLTPLHRRIIRRWLVGGRPLSGPQAYVKINSRLGRMGRSKLLWPPPPPLPFRPNPVQAVRLRWEAVAANPVAADVSRRQSNPKPNPNLNPVAADLPRRPSDQKSPITNHQSPSAPGTSPPAPCQR